MTPKPDTSSEPPVTHDESLTLSLCYDAAYGGAVSGESVAKVIYDMVREYGPEMGEQHFQWTLDGYDAGRKDWLRHTLDMAARVDEPPVTDESLPF